jgi:hypothetical protein
MTQDEFTNTNNKSYEDKECPICYENITCDVIIKCGHKICHTCYTKLSVLCTKKKCPLCNLDMIDNELILINDNKNIFLSSKISALFKILNDIKNKCIIYIHQSSHVLKLQNILKENNYNSIICSDIKKINAHDIFIMNEHYQPIPNDFTMIENIIFYDNPPFDKFTKNVYGLTCRLNQKKDIHVFNIELDN